MAGKTMDVDPVLCFQEIYTGRVRVRGIFQPELRLHYIQTANKGCHIV
jgi:hypothetical protein